MWRKGKPRALLGEMWVGAATVENNMEFPQKAKLYHMIRQLHFWVYIQKQWKTLIGKDICTPMFMAELFTKLRYGNSPSVHQLMNGYRCDAFIQWNTAQSQRRGKSCHYNNVCGLGCRSSRSRDTSGNGHVWPWSEEWSRGKANRVLPREHTGHSKHPLPTRDVDVSRWSKLKSDWLHSLQPKMKKLYTVSKNKSGNWLWLKSWTLGCQIQTWIEESRENH